MKHPLNNRELKGFEIEFYGKQTVYVAPMNYAQNNSLAIEVLCEEDGFVESFGVLTSNLGHPAQTENRAFVKTYGENDSWAKQIAEQIGSYLGVDYNTGYGNFPLYEFDLEKCYK